jgi:hypothetical protein
MEATKLMRLLTFLLAGLFVVPTQAQSPQAQKSYRIAGTVVSAIDGHPLQHATVNLLDPNDQTSRTSQTTTSDEYGHFAFTGVPAGNHILKGEMRDYLATEYDEHEGFTTGIVTGAGVDTESLVLKLRPAASIAGFVRDETNDPVEHASLHLLRQSPTSGDGRLVSAGTAQSDDRGHFEFAHLQPGSYYLVITARPWYATYPVTPQARSAQLEQAGEMAARLGEQGVFQQPQHAPFGIVDSIDPALDVAYPACFYPGTTEASAAAPIQLHGGDSLDLSFNLAPVPAVTLALAATPNGAGQPQIPQVSLTFHGQNLPVETQPRMVGNQVSLAGLAPGDYTLSSPGSNNTSSFGTSIHIDRSTSLADLPPGPGLAHIRAVLHSADGALPPHLALTLVRDHSAISTTALASPKGEVAFNVPPGDYSFEVAANGASYFVRQIVAGDKPLPGDQLDVAADESVSVSLLVRQGTHVLKGFTRMESKPFAGALVLMFLANQPGTIERVFADQSNLDGSFQLSGLIPGSYSLIAIDGGWDLDRHSPEALARYLPGALTVRIPETADKIQPLREPLPVQPR